MAAAAVARSEFQYFTGKFSGLCGADTSTQKTFSLRTIKNTKGIKVHLKHHAGILFRKWLLHTDA